jgi:hypothetical protein
VRYFTFDARPRVQCSTLRPRMPRRKVLSAGWPLRSMDRSMRIFILLAVAIALVAIGYVSSRSFWPSNTVAFATVKTLSPHEIHLNYKGMKDLPVHDSTNAF